MDNKRIAGEKAAELVKDGMIVGLGTGSTVYYTIKKLGKMVANGLKIKAVSTSSSTTTIAEKLGISLVSLNEIESIDITIDGADEVDNSLNGIKGGGGALLYEKLVAVSSEKVIWVVDSSKMINKLGKFPLPVEVIPFAYNYVFTKFKSMNYNPRIRMNNTSFFVTDAQHYIIDLYLNEIENPYELENTLNSMPGVVEHGLFLNAVDTVVVGKENSVEIINR
ncbi:ribose-5-phosphate isomerase RpiA [Brassicibacter mesophilus]|uniref:ribose-5-phosphate isomerase RpiA n=1 Tax=Brassicibacter mesophilus TaxID=745119 RepID=UPI003D1F7B85